LKRNYISGHEGEEKKRRRRKGWIPLVYSLPGKELAANSPPAVHRAKQFYKQAIKMCGIRVALGNNDHTKDNNWL
jgi:hypothetical protein